MIICVVGSCNVNDRSMLGNRDSETAVLLCDKTPLMTTMNGVPFEVCVCMGLYGSLHMCIVCYYCVCDNIYIYIKLHYRHQNMPMHYV